MLKCSRCGRQITEDRAYVYLGKQMCDDCVMDMGLSLKECDPWASYIDTSARKRRGATGTAELTETERKVYETVAAKGKATKQDIMTILSLGATDLDAQLVTLMHSELIKEIGEGGQRYLVPIPVPLL